MKKSALLIAVLLLSAPARAIELSLEENRGERGSVGYVDMQRLFTNSPDAERAKQGFEDLVRQAEERVNLRKAELLRLRQQLEAARRERDALALSMSLAPEPSTATVPAPAPTPSTAAAASPAAPPAPALSPAAAALLKAPAVSTGTAAAPAPPARELALPGMSTTGTAPTAPPAAAPKPGVPSSDGAAAPVVAPKAAPAKPGVPSSDGAAALPAVSTAAAAAAAGMFPAAPPPPVVAQAPAGPTPAQRLLEFDAKIISIQAEIAHKESELTSEHDEADRGLLDVESRKTDQVLARLYRAVSEVSRREGVSVVVDKSTVLYGNPAVDLTEKVLKYLKENAAP